MCARRSSTAIEVASDSTIRVLIVDDERPARERARELLEKEPGVEVVGSCAGAEEAVRAIRACEPDLMLFGVRAAAANGLSALKEIASERVPAVVFVTAQEERVLRAFENRDFDYVVKPIDAARLREAVRSARERALSSAPGVFERRLLSLLEDLKHRVRSYDRLVIKTGGKLWFLKTEEIDWIGAEGNYVRIHAGRESPLVRETMCEIEARLDPSRFVRIHKSTIVNTDRIREIQPLFNGTHSVLLHDGTRLTWSRGYREQLRALTGEEF
ncbi:MAG TPA: LytTR family DNA-binding domain-containing protein [Thermoanaerobaculia bacterium]|nr:LytTR family DNA-binding domain-containing protein [Thermoanaerobaculia bacterium]